MLTPCVWVAFSLPRADVAGVDFLLVLRFRCDKDPLAAALYTSSTPIFLRHIGTNYVGVG